MARDVRTLWTAAPAAFLVLLTVLAFAPIWACPYCAGNEHAIVMRCPECGGTTGIGKEGRRGVGFLTRWRAIRQLRDWGQVRSYPLFN